MVTALNDRDVLIVESVDQPMFLIDAPRPVALIIEAQGFRLAHTLRRACARSQAQLDNAFQFPGVMLRPPPQVFQRSFSPGKA
jgi:hypothetical protein